MKKFYYVLLKWICNSFPDDVNNSAYCIDSHPLDFVKDLNDNHSEANGLHYTYWIEFFSEIPEDVYLRHKEDVS